MAATEAEIRDLYQRYAGVLFSRCRSILGDAEEAEDVVQDTFAKVIRSWDEFRAESSPLTWMYRISTNLCLNRLRDGRGRRDKRERHKELLVGDGTSAPRAVAWEDAETVRRLLEGADDQTRAILIHLYFDDMTREETAKMVGISVPTLRKRLEAFQEKARAFVELSVAVFLLFWGRA